MSYRHIENLYKNKDIMVFKQCYAMEKIHGTSAHIQFKTEDSNLIFFSGGSPYDTFVSLFNQSVLIEKFLKNAAEHPEVTSVAIYGESYGGKVQRMSHTYGPNQKFVAFEVMINRDIENWLEVPRAEKFANAFDCEFVHYKLINTTEEEINAEMMADSVQAVRNGMGTGHMREGIVLRPLVELIHPNGGRIISKHKRPEFAERANTPSINDPEKQKVLEDAKAVAEEWINAVRLQHVLDAIGIADPQMEDAQKIIKGMIEDVYREAAGEIIESKDVSRAIGKQTMKELKSLLMGTLK